MTTCSGTTSSRSAWDRVLLLCHRQAGKSTTAAALAVLTALLEPGSLVLLLSPSQRQSGELFRKAVWLMTMLGFPVPPVRETMTEVALVNGSRIVSLPGQEQTVRCYSSVKLLVIDEAARVPDDLYHAVRPMLAVSQGKLVALSTAWAKQGWYYHAWTGDEDWQRIKVVAWECPRISREFLAAERVALGARWFAMEYGCEFGEAVDSVFRAEDLQAMLSDDVQPLVL